MADKFKCGPSESVVMKGNLVYTEGEAGVMNAIKGKYKVVQATGFITNQRVVVCKRPQYYLWGALIILIIYLFMRNKILYEIALADIESVRPDGKSRAFIVRTRRGVEFKLQSANLFDNRAAWMEAIGRAVTQSLPKVRAVENQGMTQFLNG